MLVMMQLILLCVICMVMDAQTPIVQAEDLIMDVEVTRWGFLRALSHEERKVSDPAYRAELALEETELAKRLKLTEKASPSSAT